MRVFLFDVKLENGTSFEEIVSATSRPIAESILEENYPIASLHLITIL